MGIVLPPVGIPESPISQGRASPATSQPQQPVVPSSDREEAAEEDMELTVPAYPPQPAAHRQIPPHAQVDEAITNMVMQIRRTGASTSTVASSQRDSQASGTSTKDLSLTRIPRVSTKESNPPRASSSSHRRSSHRDRTRSNRQPVYPCS